VGFPDADAVLERYPDQLSGGMSQRAMIAMILSMEPALLLADEPTSALDATVQLEVLELLSRINREEGTGVLLVTHDIGVAMRYAHRIAVASGGRVVEEGRADTFAESAARLTPESRELLESHYTLRHGRAEASAGPP
jgi:ABC-type dipeptide/oligopeptide/nickel transport system ATPase component